MESSESADQDKSILGMVIKVVSVVGGLVAVLSAVAMYGSSSRKDGYDLGYKSAQLELRDQEAECPTKVKNLTFDFKSEKATTGRLITVNDDLKESIRQWKLAYENINRTNEELRKQLAVVSRAQLFLEKINQTESQIKQLRNEQNYQMAEDRKDRIERELSILEERLARYQDKL